MNQAANSAIKARQIVGASGERAMTEKSPVALVMSRDRSLIDLARGSCAFPWRIERLQPLDGLGIASEVRIIVVDDSAVEANERGWLLAQIRHRAPDALLIYVTAHHGPANETRARASGAHFYISKPIEPVRFARVLRSFGRAAGLEPEAVAANGAERNKAEQ